MAKIISIRLDDHLYAQLADHAKRRNMKNISSFARDLLRRGVGLVRSEGEAGYQEGIYRGMDAVHRKIQELREEDFQP